MIVTSVASADPLASVLTATRPIGEPAEFAAALAAASSRGLGNDGSEESTHRGDPTEGEAPSATANADRLLCPIDPALALLVAANSTAEPPVEGGAAAPAAGATSVMAAALPGRVLTVSSPRQSPTVADVGALLEVVAGKDLVALAMRSVEAMSATATPGPAAEVTVAALLDQPPEPDATELAQPLPPAPLPASGARPEAAAPASTLEPRRLVDQLAPQLAPRLEHGGELRITLQPESLGTIDVAIRVSPAGIHVHIVADDIARDLLQAGLAELRGALRPADGRELAVEVAARLNGGFDANTPFDRGNPWSAPPPPRRFRVDAPPEGRDVAPTSTVASGRIDYRV